MKVLIVDDESLICRSLKRVFELKMHEVFIADNGIDGLAEWKKSKPDVVILDVLMPGLTGPQVLKEMGASASQAKVILISAYTGEYDLNKAREMGADIFVPKPFENIFDIVSIAEGLLQKA